MLTGLHWLALAQNNWPQENGFDRIWSEVYMWWQRPMVRSFGTLICKCSKKNPAWEVSEWWVGVSFQSRIRFHMGGGVIVKILNHRGKIAQNQMIPNSSSKTSKTQAINSLSTLSWNKTLKWGGFPWQRPGVADFHPSGCNDFSFSRHPKIWITAVCTAVLLRRVESTMVDKNIPKRYSGSGLFVDLFFRNKGTYVYWFFLMIPNYEVRWGHSDSW